MWSQKLSALRLGRNLEPWGPPGFFQIAFKNGDPVGILGAMQRRRDLVSGLKMTGPECTFAVDDISQAVNGLEAHGAEIVLAKTTIPGVGHLLFFRDLEGNILGAMEYDSSAG